MRVHRVLSLFVAGTLLSVGVGNSQEKKFEMTPVKYSALKEEVLKHRGKVVLVDFWAGY